MWRWKRSHSRKCLGMNTPQGGVGMASVALGRMVVVAALIVVKRWGDVIDPTV